MAFELIKVSELPELTTPSDPNVIPIQDGDYLKRISFENLKEAVTDDVADDLAAEVTAREGAVSGEATARGNADTAILADLASPYSASSTYAVGDYCTKDGQLYRCTTAISTAEAWTVAHWSAVALGDDTRDLRSAVDVLNEDVIDVIGINNTLTITKITGLNNPTNGTAFTSGANYETYYISVTQGLYYTWTADKSSASPSLRLSYSQLLPAAGVACTFIEEQAIYSTPVTFHYYASSSGFLSISVWKNQTNASLMSVKEEKSGALGEIYAMLDAVSDKINNPIFVGSSARTVEVETNTIKARKLIDYNGEDTPETYPGGLAIYKNLALVGYNYGYFGAFDLTTGELIATGRGPYTSSHNNNLFFDARKMVGNYPVFYSSYCTDGLTYCDVFSMSISGSALTVTPLQRITYSGTYFSSDKSVDWCHDEKTNELVAVISKNGETVNIVKFAMPLVFSQTVFLTDSDVVSAVTNTDITVRQGCSISNDCLFILDGSSSGDLIVIDLGTGETVNSISLAPMSENEPEGLAIANGKVYVNFHSGESKLSANLFEMKF